MSFCNLDSRSPYASHLINRVSYSILDNKTPFSVLYLEKQPFDLPSKHFLCACFVQILEKRQ